MTKNIYDLANELERAIRQLPEYQAIEASKTAVEADETAKQIWSDYVSFQQEIQNLLQAGQVPDKEAADKMQEFGKAIQGNSLLTDYMMKQQQLSVYVSDLEKIIFKPLQDVL